MHGQLLALLHAPVAAAREREQAHTQDELAGQEDEEEDEEENGHGHEGDQVVGAPPRAWVGGDAAVAEGGAAEGAAEVVVDVLQGGGGGGRGGGGGLDGEGAGGGGDGEGHVRGEEHVVGLDGGADEEARERDDG